MSDEQTTTPISGPTNEWDSVRITRVLEAAFGAWRAGALTDDEWEAKRTALTDQLQAAAAAEYAAAAANVDVGLLTINTPPVVAGELIEAAWGNTVRNDLLALDSGKLNRAGGTMTGTLTMSGANINLAGNLITNVGDPTAGTHGMSRSYADGRYVNLTGGNMSGALQVGGDGLNGDGWRTNGIGQVNQRRSNAQTSGTILITHISDAVGAGQRFISFHTGASGIVGGIALVAGNAGVVYQTSSDRRLKVRSGDADDAASIVAQLGALAYRGHWINDEAGEEWVFLNSQDVEPFAPFAVTGDGEAVATQDDVDEGVAAEVGQPIPQQLDHTALVPLLTAALSQTLDRVDTLSARIDALEGAAT